jgi:hypothetical protein
MKPDWCPSSYPQHFTKQFPGSVVRRFPIPAIFSHRFPTRGDQDHRQRRRVTPEACSFTTPITPPGPGATPKNPSAKIL